MNKGLIITLSIVIPIILIFFLIGIIFYNWILADFKQESEIKKELIGIYELAADGEMNSKEMRRRLNRTISRDDYAIVERAYKNYLTDIFEEVIDLQELKEETRLKEILLNENLIQDAPEFLKSKEIIETEKEEIDSYKKSFQNLFYEKKAMSYLYGKNLDSYYIDFYKDEILNQDKIRKILGIDEKIEELEEFSERVDNTLSFLIEHQDRWEIKEDKIVFDSDVLTKQFLELFRKGAIEQDSSENSGEFEKQVKDFGIYEVPSTWMESKTHSTKTKFFYIKEGEAEKEKPNNISVQQGTNRYAQEDHVKFRQSILNQLMLQLGDNAASLEANGSHTDQGYVLYTFEMKEDDAITKQYYIIGDYQYVLVHETIYDDSAKDQVDEVARSIVDSFTWAKNG